MKWELVGIAPRRGKDPWTDGDFSDILRLENGRLLLKGEKLKLKKKYVREVFEEVEYYIPVNTILEIWDIDCWDPCLKKYKTWTRCFYPTYKEPVISFYYPGFWAKGIQVEPERRNCDIAFTYTELLEYFEL